MTCKRKKAVTIVLAVFATLLLTCEETDVSGKRCMSIKQFVLSVSIFVSLFLTAVITVAPSSVTVSIYTLANFTCEGIGNVLSWSVEGNSVTDLSNQDREISVTTNNISVDVWSSVLTIRALPINDGITVQCNVIRYNPFDLKQKGAPLIIKGNLKRL